MRKPLRPHREGHTIVGGVSEVILTVLYDKRKRVTFWVTPFLCGGGRRSRTDDPLLAKQVL